MKEQGLDTSVLREAKKEKYKKHYEKYKHIKVKCDICGNEYNYYTITNHKKNVCSKGKQPKGSYIKKKSNDIVND